MTKVEQIEKLLEAMKEVEEDIKVLQNNINKAKEILANTNSEDIDEDFVYEYLDIEEGLKHIELS